MSALLFDENLSHNLVRELSALFQGSRHVRDVGLAHADDARIWEYAEAEGLTIVTKDDDFRQLSFLRGAPPKVIWVNLGNCQTSEISNLLRARVADIERFVSDTESALLVLMEGGRT